MVIVIVAMIRLKRVYERIDVSDGERILVDRLWPRGIRRSTSNIDIWVKDVAPSNELRKWFAHDPRKWQSFKKKYRDELRESRALDKLAGIVSSADPVTLLYSASDKEHNNAVVLLEVLKRKLKKLGGE